MLVVKLTLVPLFIAAITLAGRRWGMGVAGLLAGLPVVAGPIAVFLALEHGPAFGAQAATAAISAVFALMAFGIAYCWASVRWVWPAALACALASWFAAASLLAVLPPLPVLALAIAGASLALAPRLLPAPGPVPSSGARRNDLPYRMLAGALLTLAVTGLAAHVGQVWSGLLAVFPVLGATLSVFTHRAEGGRPVVHLYHAMVRGLYSFAAFFLALALLWPRTGFWTACAAAVAACLLAQWLVQRVSRSRLA
ncbi:hypothetical protein JI739_20420 [Ramlibacter sp. AW1]|uniref:Uncharacterized protein n=1 Tax=Ramlibacter aurantiacus TaxID=2801330 RepID=A0A936ZUB8_9BURK|nr:hypothetical protein [Ramlibacter aurantiacus]MBL0422711.1 hypothetical protein [Ramlibacter aurantiacus]